VAETLPEIEASSSSAAVLACATGTSLVPVMVMTRLAEEEVLEASLAVKGTVSCRVSPALRLS